jgi:hypothetical protein
MDPIGDELGYARQPDELLRDDHSISQWKYSPPATLRNQCFGAVSIHTTAGAMGATLPDSALDLHCNAGFRPDKIGPVGLAAFSQAQQLALMRPSLPGRDDNLPLEWKLRVSNRPSRRKPIFQQAHVKGG